ncbi:MAG TPA: efflux RND transporter periplasmic adaptor subunit [Pirellulales bacterium]|jgi:membrane fusion protein (multidrug efflux system)|nr:efflux RND transporter periplasmic adaptor subunit [Pirellulales bacterium]
MKVSPIPAIVAALICSCLPGCGMHTEKEEEHAEAHRITCTNPESESVTIVQRYVCQIHSQRHIEVRALERGYLKAITIKEGQMVKAGDVMFQVIPVLYEKKAEAESAEAKLAELEYDYTKKLYKDKVVSQNEVLLLNAKKDKAEANADLAKAELNFAAVKAPFDGIVDRLHCQQGSLVKEGDVLSTLSDNSVMWVYFNVPEARYLEYMAHLKEHKEDLKVELVLANGEKFDQPGKISAIEADFNNENGNIPFRADFPNPNGLLRNGQTGTILISRVQKDAIVIPQRATFEVLQKRYVYVVDKDGVAHQREIDYEEVEGLDDLFIIKSGIGAQDKIILEGIRQVRDGDKVKCEYRKPEKVVPGLKYHAE